MGNNDLRNAKMLLLKLAVGFMLAIIIAYIVLTFPLSVEVTEKLWRYMLPNVVYITAWLVSMKVASALSAGGIDLEISYPLIVTSTAVVGVWILQIFFHPGLVSTVWNTLTMIYPALLYMSVLLGMGSAYRDISKGKAAVILALFIFIPALYFWVSNMYY